MCCTLEGPANITKPILCALAQYFTHPADNLTMIPQSSVTVYMPDVCMYRSVSAHVYMYTTACSAGVTFKFPLDISVM